MLDSSIADQFISYFERLLPFYNKFLELENQKNEDLKKNRLDRLDGLMRQEEAYVLRARGLELERQNLMKLTDNPDAVFSELLPAFVPDRREKLQRLFNSLSSTLLRLRELNESSNQLLQIKARSASAVLEKLERHPELKKVYNEKMQAQASAHSASIFSKKI